MNNELVCGLFHGSLFLIPFTEQWEDIGISNSVKQQQQKFVISTSLVRGFLDIVSRFISSLRVHSLIWLCTAEVLMSLVFEVS